MADSGRSASVFNEFALKKNFETSVHLQNFFMYFYGAVFNLVGLVCVVIFRGGEVSVFHGHNSLTMLLVAWGPPSLQPAPQTKHTRSHSLLAC